MVAPHGSSARAQATIRLLRRRLGLPDGDPFAVVKWERRDVSILAADGSPAFAQEGVEAPVGWSDLAVATVARRYFLRPPAGPGEDSVRALLRRVVSEIGGWAADFRHVRGPEQRALLESELVALVLTERGTFATPVWLNVGTGPQPLTAACFILSVEDSLESLLDWNVREGLIFQQGAGAGVNLSAIRSSREPVSRGGLASGPVSFMRGADAWAATIRSGGRARRGAKMVLLDADHPDVLEFVGAKAGEEERARALLAAGWDEGETESSLAFQHSNHAVRVPHAFMSAAVKGAEWTLHAPTTGQPVETLPARALLRECARAAWSCGDPGLQFADTIESWHTCPRSGPISASNPCGEFMHVDDSACNLATLNLLRFLDRRGRFDVEGFVHAVELMLLAQDALVDGSGYPSEATRRNAHRFRPLGLGHANLAAALLFLGLPYDSEDGRGWAAAVTALMSGAAYRQSARLAAALDPFDEFERNREPMLGVIDRHRAALERLPLGAPGEIVAAAATSWRDARELGGAHGFRNAQVTLIPPTGTVSLMLDCETTGIEPYYSFAGIKRFGEGGQARLQSRVLPAALRRLGYGGREVTSLSRRATQLGTLVGARSLRAEHDQLVRTAVGSGALPPSGQVAMIAAVQPFVSGGIAMTVNMPHSASIDDVESVFLDAWRQGLKGITVYRQGSKALQPMRAPSDDDPHGPPQARG